jgi:hypothetical protein
MDRRSAFQQLAARFLVAFDETRGQEHISIKELARLERPRLESLVPLLRPDVEIRSEGGRLICRDPQTDAVHKLARINAENRLLLRLIDGRRTMGDIVQAMRKSSAWDEERAFSIVKKAVFRLLLSQVCVIVNPPEMK